MAINFAKYVDITSAVGGNGGVSARDLIGRLFTTNPIIATNAILEFTDAASVGEYFGLSSDEYKRAQFYFGFISKNITSAKKIQFARWASAATAPQIFGSTGSFLLSAFTGISDGSLDLTIGATNHTVTGMDFTGEASLAGVASVIEAAIQAADVAAVWATATVAYNSTPSRFEFTGGATGANVISVADAGAGTDIRELVGWGASAIYSAGVDTQTLTEILTSSTVLSNNYASLAFVLELSDDEMVEVAEWNAGNNLLFIYCAPLDVDGELVLSGYAGTTVTVTDTTSSPNEYPEMIPMILLAATDYARRNSSQNYMYQTFDITPLSKDGHLLTTSESNDYDADFVNYYAATQTAGKFVSFYQRGKMQGNGTTDPRAQNVFANEIWLKDAAGVSILNLLLALAKVSANIEGRAQIMAVLQSVIDQALFNGVISVGKPFSVQQKLYISQLSGDDDAWRQVENLGYWLNVVLTQDDDEWIATYTLIYSKDDVVNKVVGSHVLI